MLFEKNSQVNNKSLILIKVGLGILALSFGVILIYYFPVIRKEIGYFLSKPDSSRKVVVNEDNGAAKEKVIIVADKTFSLVIPKIAVNTKVIKNVDPQDPKQYLQDLSQGVAHAKGTSLPGQEGNTFYFAHSSDSFYNANRYNSVFYLLNKLVKGDAFYIAYNNILYKYAVTQVKVVNPTEINYLKGDMTKKTATLMTCWPAGTTLKRLVVLGEQINQ